MYIGKFLCAGLIRSLQSILPWDIPWHDPSHAVFFVALCPSSNSHESPQEGPGSLITLGREDSSRKSRKVSCTPRHLAAFSKISHGHKKTFTSQTDLAAGFA